jgi:dynein heavy chain
MQRLGDNSDLAKTYNMRESLTDNDETSYENVHQTKKEFEVYYNLWTTIDKYRTSEKSWRHDDFEKLDPQDLEETVDNSFRTLGKAITLFRTKGITNLQKIAEKVKDEVGDFKQYVGMAQAMRTDGIKDRHWAKISQAVNFDVKPFEGFNLQWCIDKGMVDHTESIEQEGNVANKEYTIETQLAKMKSEWEEVFFNCKDFKTSGSYTVGGFDDAYMLLDDHIMITQAQQFSQFNAPFREEIDEWYTMLRMVQDVCEEWVRCQGNWTYLWPVFDSPDIMKQLVMIGRMFKGVDKTWKEILKETKANPNVMKSCNREGLLSKFVQMNENLDFVQRGLRDYLGEKRSIFARFYFLSDDDLLSILSQTKEVENVKPHLKKVFENMADLRFELDQTITIMYSGEKEEIPFVNPVDPKDKKVEFWMGEIQDAMFMTIREVLKESIIDYSKTKRTDWIQNHPGQCVLNGSQVHWTNDIEDAMKKEGLLGVKKYYDQICAELLNTVSMVAEFRT